MDIQSANRMFLKTIQAFRSISLQATERDSISKTDFVHKLKVALKELRETSISLKIVKRTGLAETLDDLGPSMSECDELIAMFVRSVITAESSLKKGRA